MNKHPIETIAVQRATLSALTYADENPVVRELLEQWALPAAQREQIVAQARNIVRRARERRSARGTLEIFLQEFGLSTDEGLALMCLAEALLRVPDDSTADNLIAEKIGSSAWDQHAGQSDSTLLNFATRALKLSGQLVEMDEHLGGRKTGMLRSLVNRLGEPAVRAGVRQAMYYIGNEFVLGRTIEEALQRIGTQGTASFDMLGEGARTARDAQRHFDSYLHAIRATAAAPEGLHDRHSVSVKLSALHPRYEYANQARVMTQLLPKLKALALMARQEHVQLTIDAEEAARLEISLDLIEALARDPQLADWDGLGLAVQCYSKRATAVFDWLIALGHETGRRFRVRLVKGAYWDTEIKHAQELGIRGYPVFTRKVTTDLSYLVCASKALAHPDVIYPQFATHNAHTIAAVMSLAGPRRDFEFQRLHGMGELVYAAAKEVFPDMPGVRVYAPVGVHNDLLAYLVRRLLENGANSSFVNRFMDESVTLEQLIEDPGVKLRSLQSIPNPNIPLPVALYGAARRNSAGLDLSDPRDAAAVVDALAAHKESWQAGPLRAGGADVVNPADHSDVVGHVTKVTVEDVNSAVAAAVAAQPHWDRAGADARAEILERAATALEAKREQFLSLLVREAGKTPADAIAEIREAADFCRYYAAQAREHFGAAKELVGPTGEQNLYSLHGRGAFVCISPWNFPLAIFVGQITAALAAGNSVLAKPAAQTPLVAAAAVELLHQSGVPADVLHLLIGSGSVIGGALVADERIAGVTMTGSTATAKMIARTLIDRRGPIVPLIAETGGQNVMFVDSTALPEQVADDVVRSAFHSAGQRCSALRVLYVQEEIADRVIDLLKGAMDELKIGDPAELDTDVGPVIDKGAQAQLMAHVEELTADGCLLHVSRTHQNLDRGSFVAPHLFAIDSIQKLTDEHFGPLLHVIRFGAKDLARHLQEVRDTGFGLTLGVHTRINAVARHIFDATPAGNVYVNRNMIGAVVGVQPFGGHGLSGTGPKAGGPLYLQRFATERVLTINTAATGGNVALLRTQTED